MEKGDTRRQQENINTLFHECFQYIPLKIAGCGEALSSTPAGKVLDDSEISHDCQHPITNT